VCCYLSCQPSKGPIPRKPIGEETLPNDVAMEIIDLVHVGYDKIIFINGQPILMRYYYIQELHSSVRHQRADQVEYMQLYGFSNASSLRRHLHQHHPGAMHLHPGDIKQEHTPLQRAETKGREVHPMHPDCAAEALAAGNQSRPLLRCLLQR
jgi:hypothetical protein